MDTIPSHTTILVSFRFHSARISAAISIWFKKKLIVSENVKDSINLLYVEILDDPNKFAQVGKSIPVNRADTRELLQDMSIKKKEEMIDCLLIQVSFYLLLCWKLSACREIFLLFPVFVEGIIANRLLESMTAREGECRTAAKVRRKR